MGLKIYKKGQGKILRYFAIFSLLLLELYGCWSLYWFLNRWEVLSTFPFAFEIPLSDDLMLSWRLLIACIGFLGLGAGTLFSLNKVRIVDLLVDTETELKKITWPSWAEAVNSSIVVILFVSLLAVFIIVVDTLYARIFNLIF